MSKTYIVSRNGGTVTKAPINDNKIPIYANETALDADLSNLADNTLVLLQNSGVYEVYTENGTKKKKQITGNGYGLPLGSIIAVYSNLVPDGYLPCNGATFDTTTYAALYAYLGSNRLPDLRECNLVGAGQSSNEYDASTNPNGIHEHDVYVVGEFKDDQFQGHHHEWYPEFPNGRTDLSKARRFSLDGGANYNFYPDTNGTMGTVIGKACSDGTNGDPRIGSTTHGKQVGVNYCIKATPAYVEPDTVSDMVNTLRTQDSYSTEEVNTGKKWIDGKPIYRRCIPFGNKTVSKTSQTVTTELNNTVISTLINQGLTWSTGATSFANGSYMIIYVNQTDIHIASTATTFTTGANAYCWFEYTKTTD